MMMLIMLAVCLWFHCTLLLFVYSPLSYHTSKTNTFADLYFTTISVQRTKCTALQGTRCNKYQTVHALGKK